MIVLYSGKNNTGVFEKENGDMMCEAPAEVVSEAARMMLPCFRFCKPALLDAGIDNVLVPSIRHIITAVQTCRERKRGK